jgi:alpha-mannosidase
MALSKMEQLKGALAGAQAAKARWGQRFAAEVEFAEGLLRLHPQKAPAWRKLIDRAVDAVADAVSDGGISGLEEAVRAAEARLASIGKAAKAYTIHCVGHAHIDMNWLWAWPETVAVTNDTFSTVLKLMDEFDDFCFSQSQASVYDIARRYCPELFDRIRARIAEGRWEVTAVHWVEGDKNLAAGESLARHMLYTRRFTQEHLGLGPDELTLDWEPDTFGHAHTIPSIISRGGVRRYYMCRGGADPKPPVFWWQGPDGSRVLVYLETTWYNGGIDEGNAPALVAFCEKTGLHDWMNVFGVGDHGGGPTRRDLLRCREMDGWPIYPNFRFGTAARFYDILEAEGARWPVLDCELNYEFTGCYTSQSRIKRANRLGENYCLEAETAAALAWRAIGRTYPADRIREAWTNTLFGHFHDILPGSGITPTREYQLGLFQATAAATGMVKTHSLRGIAAEVDTSFACAAQCKGGDGSALGAGAGSSASPSGVSRAAGSSGAPAPYVVFNPNGWQRDEVVTANVWGPESEAGVGDMRRMRFSVRRPDGTLAAGQVVGSGNYWGHNFVEVAFPVSVGPFGYAACSLEEGQAPEPQGGARCLAGWRGGERQPAGQSRLENEFLEVAFDHACGGVVRLLDKRTGRDLADPGRPLGLPEYVLERPRGMTAWITADPRRTICPLELVSLDPGQTGPYVASMVARARVNGSDVTVTYTLKAGQPWLEIDVRARWIEIGNEQGTPALRMRFPFALNAPKARYEIPFGSIERDLNAGEEVPALRWADVSDGQAGCTLVNDSKYGHSLDGSTLRLVLVRSSKDPDPHPEVGDHEVRMALAPHGPAPAVADLVRLGAGFNHPLLVIGTDVHSGRLPSAGAALAGVAPANIVVTSLKKAEAFDALIVRVQETAGRKTRATLKLDAALVGRPAEALEVDLLERPAAASTAKVSEQAVSVQVAALGIASVRIAFRE